MMLTNGDDVEAKFPKNVSFFFRLNLVAFSMIGPLCGFVETNFNLFFDISVIANAKDVYRIFIS